MALIEAGAQDAPVSRWRIFPTPTFSTTRHSESPSNEVIDVNGAVRLSDGTVVVGDNGSQSIKWFNPSGALVRSVGRQGDGPGEYRLVKLIGTCGSDSLFVFDGANRRLSILSLEGRLLGTRALSTDATELRSPSEIRCSGTRQFGLLGQPRSPIPTNDVPFRSGVLVRIQTIDGSRTVDAGTTASSERHRFGSSAGPRPLGKRSVLAVSAAWLYVGTGDSAAIEVLDLGGRRRPIQLPFERRRISRADINRFVDGLVRANPRVPEATVRSLYSGLEYPSFFPAHGELLVDSDNNLWVEEYRSPGQSRSRWVIYDTGHRLLGEIQMPPRFRLLEVGRDYVLGTWTNSDDVKHVQMYRLVR